MVSLAVDEAEEPPNSGTGVPFRKRDYLLGIALLLVVVFLWTASNFVTQALFQGGYHKPFLVTYLNTSSFTLYLLPFLFRYMWRRKTDDEAILQRIGGQYTALPASEQDALENPMLYVRFATALVYTIILLTCGSKSARVPYVPTDVSHSNDAVDAQLAPLTTAETAHLAFIFCFFWFVANWTLNASLDYTSVASATILSSTSGFLTLAIGRLFSVETLTPPKIIAVATSFVGVLLVSLSDNSSKVPDTSGSVIQAVSTVLQAQLYTNPLLGDFLALLAAAFYALYVILLKVRIKTESRIHMQLFFGFVGLFNILALFPIGILLHFTGHEPFELPSTGKSWGAVLLNMFITFSSDYIYVMAMLKTTPLVVTLGLSLTIPLAVVGDEILNIPTKVQAILGALLVLAGFGLVGWESNRPGSKEQVCRIEGGIAETETPRAISPDASESEGREVIV